MVSVKGKYLTEFPHLLKELDNERNGDIDISKLHAGSNTDIYWHLRKLHSHHETRNSERP